MKLLIVPPVFGILGLALGFALFARVDGHYIGWQEVFGNFAVLPSTVFKTGAAGFVLGILATVLTSRLPRTLGESAPSATSGMPAGFGDEKFCRLLSLLTLGILRFFTVPQGMARIITAFGRYLRAAGPGFRSCVSVWGIYQKPGDLVPLKEQIKPFTNELVFTSDGVKCRIDIMICFKIVDPGKAIYEVTNYQDAIEKIVQAVLRNECGRQSARTMLSGREQMAASLRATLDKDVVPWGIEVRLVEITNIKIAVQEEGS